ncbi:hypothetical protein AAEU42_14540 [Pseudoflavonifractor phocaeensis]|uniref:hypothetical protein n=1 Tax=Pseudoflavonifractor phocaeensis TaxID=1870988 RepID=UPI00313B709E
MRLIDADKIPYVQNEDGVLEDFAYRYDVNTLPTVEAMPVVRCGECCFGQKPISVDMQEGYMYCKLQCKYKDIDAFCSEGEPREARDGG